VVVGGLNGAEDGGAGRAAQLGERVGDGRQGGRAQQMLFLQTPAEGDTHTHYCHGWMTSDGLTRPHHLGLEEVWHTRMRLKSTFSSLAFYQFDILRL